MKGRKNIQATSVTLLSRLIFNFHILRVCDTFSPPYNPLCRFLLLPNPSTSSIPTLPSLSVLLSHFSFSCQGAYRISHILFFSCFLFLCDLTLVTSWSFTFLSKLLVFVQQPHALCDLSPLVLRNWNTIWNSQFQSYICMKRNFEAAFTPILTTKKDCAVDLFVFSWN